VPAGTDAAAGDDAGEEKNSRGGPKALGITARSAIRNESSFAKSKEP